MLLVESGDGAGSSGMHENSVPRIATRTARERLLVSLYEVAFMTCGMRAPRTVHRRVDGRDLLQAG